MQNKSFKKGKRIAVVTLCSALVGMAGLGVVTAQKEVQKMTKLPLTLPLNLLK